MTNRNKPWDSDTLELVAWAGLIGGFFLCVAAFSVFSFHMESATFNRLTGAHTTWWDAAWVELRVQEAPKGVRDVPR